MHTKIEIEIVNEACTKDVNVGLLLHIFNCIIFVNSQFYKITCAFKGTVTAAEVIMNFYCCPPETVYRASNRL